MIRTYLITLPLLALLLLSSTALATDDCAGDPGFRIDLPSTAIPIGAWTPIAIEAPGAATAYVFLSNGAGPTPSPAGPLCISFPLLDVPAAFPIPASGRSEFDCFIPCSSSFLQGTLHAQFVAIVWDEKPWLGRSNAVEITFYDNGCQDLCPAPAEDDSDFFSGGAGHALWTQSCIGTDYVFVGGEEKFNEYGDGTARLTGRLGSITNPGSQFLVDVTFSGRVNPGDDSFPPADSPKKELHSAAYVENGGPIDASTWHYYLVTEGMLIGLEDEAGCAVSLSRMGPAFQVGEGASGKNLHYGASGWLDLLFSCTGEDSFECRGDFNLDLNICDAD